jgi:hypothetical protein
MSFSFLSLGLLPAGQPVQVETHKPNRVDPRALRRTFGISVKILVGDQQGSVA